MIGFYQDCAQARGQKEPVDEAVTDELRRNLKAEIECYKTLQDLYHAMQISILHRCSTRACC